jgi:hypothetical protein
MQIIPKFISIHHALIIPRERLIPVLLCKSLIPDALAWEGRRDCALRRRRLGAWTKTRPTHTHTHARTHTVSYHIFVLLCPKHATDLQMACKLTERKTNSENSCCCADGPLRVTTLCITTLFHFFSSPNHSWQSNVSSHGHLRDGQYKNQKSWSGRLRSFVTFARSHFEKRDRMT